MDRDLYSPPGLFATFDVLVDVTGRRWSGWWAVGDLGCSSDLDTHKT